MLIPCKFSGYRAGIRIYPGKSSGSSAPPPDPRLVEAQIQSMGKQNQAIDRMMQLADEFAPLQKEQMQWGLDTGKQAWQQSQDDRTWMLGRRGELSKLQDNQINDAKNFNLEGRSNELIHQADADLNSGYSSGMAMNARALERKGGNPFGGAAAAMGNQSALELAKATAGAHAQVRAAAKAEGYALNDRAANSLSGYPAMAMTATGAGAGYGASGLGLVNSGVAGMSAPISSAGGMAGQIGANATGMYNAQANYKNQQDQIAAANDPMNGLLGMAASAGMNYMLPGSSVLANKSAFSWK